MSKERLEEIKDELIELQRCEDTDKWIKDFIFNHLKIEWIIEKAEQNKRYREMYEYLKGSESCVYVDHVNHQDAISLRDYKDIMCDLRLIVERDDQ